MTAYASDARHRVTTVAGLSGTSPRKSGHVHAGTDGRRHVPRRLSRRPPPGRPLSARAASARRASADRRGTSPPGPGCRRDPVQNRLIEKEKTTHAKDHATALSATRCTRSPGLSEVSCPVCRIRPQPPSLAASTSPRAMPRALREAATTSAPKAKTPRPSAPSPRPPASGSYMSRPKPCWNGPMRPKSGPGAREPAGTCKSRRDGLSALSPCSGPCRSRGLPPPRCDAAVHVSQRRCPSRQGRRRWLLPPVPAALS